MRNRLMTKNGWTIFLILMQGVCPGSFGESLSDLARSVGVTGGVMVYVECGNGHELAGLRLDQGTLIQGLDTDPTKVDQARVLLQRQGVYGPVAVDRWDGRNLPFVDNFVNLILAADTQSLTIQEIARVLCPRGVVCIKADSNPVSTEQMQQAGLQVRRIGPWLCGEKPWSGDLDEWTHFLHGPGNNAVSADKVVAPPRHLQWVGGPRYSRHHDKMSSVSAVVSTGGRVFTIVDVAPPFSILTPPQWKLVARDAFNGSVLWRRDMGPWYSHMHGLKSGPADLPRKLVAVENRLYVTLELYGPVSILDAVTGQTLSTLKGSRGTEEILVSQGHLFAQINNATEQPAAARNATLEKPNDPPRSLVAYDLATNNRLWSVDYPMLKGTLAVDDTRVVFVSNETLVCLDRTNGKVQWTVPGVLRRSQYPTRFTPTLVLKDGVALFAGGELAGAPKRGNRSWDVNKNDTLTAFNAETGEVLWQAPHPHSGYASSEDLLVIKGVVWVGETTGGAAVGTFKGYDLKSGKLIKQFDPDVDTYWFHHRCYRGKATDNYLLMSRTGLEFVDPQKETWDVHHWTRGACLYGVMPANGLIYTPQNPCACFMEAKQVGFNAYAGKRFYKPADPEPALHEGPAFNADIKAEAGHPEDWPTFRHDPARSAHSRTTLSATLNPLWTARIGGRLSSPIVAQGRIYVASIDTHTVIALDAKTGSRRWQFTAGGRVDSPPSYWQGRVIFGSADGHVYCLRAADGALIWRFRACPQDQRTMAFGQLESVWPVHGSVLIHDDVVSFVTGRSAFLDGGMVLFRLDPRNGKVLSRNRWDEKGTPGGPDIQAHARQLNMPTALPDILSTDGRYLYMRSLPLHLNGTPLPLESLEYTAKDPEKFGITLVQKPEHAHLFSPTGFLDDTWWHRTYWVYGSHFFSGWSGYTRGGQVAPAGRLLVMDRDTVYGFGRKQKFYRWTTPIEHVLFAAAKNPEPVKAVRGRLEKGQKRPRQHRWEKDIPLFARALLLNKGVLYVAGPADIVDEEKIHRQWDQPAVKVQTLKQAQIMAGTEGGILWAVDSQTGETLFERTLNTVPVFNGMAAARGRLYVSGVDGALMALE